MAIVDTDLLAIQEARFALEGATRAKAELEDLHVSDLARAMEALQKGLTGSLFELCQEAVCATDYSNTDEDTELAEWVLTDIFPDIMSQNAAGTMQKLDNKGAYTITLSRGVALTLLPEWLCIPTLLCEIGFALWSKSPLIVCVPARVIAPVKKLMDKIDSILSELEYPKGALTLISCYAPEAEAWLVSQEALDVIVCNREKLEDVVAAALSSVQKTGPKLYLCTLGNNPVFVEKTADLDQVVEEVVLGKSYCYGLLPGAEQSIVVESSVADTLRQKLIAAGCAFLDASEAKRVADVIFSPAGEPYMELAGKSAADVARRANVEVAPNTRVLVIEHPYVSAKDPLTRAKYAPLMCFYVEDDWQNACEKCIELILGEGAGNVLSIFSHDAEVIRLFAEVKPVARVMVNASCALGAIGAHVSMPKTLVLCGWKQAGKAGAGLDVASFTKQKRVSFRLEE